MPLAFGPFLFLLFRRETGSARMKKASEFCWPHCLALSKAGKGLVDLGDNLGNHAEELIDMAFLDA